MIVPGGRCQLFIHEVSANHESLVTLHFRRRGMQQSGCAVCQLRRKHERKKSKPNDKEQFEFHN